MRIRPVADDQAQIVESSHLLVFAAWSKIDKIAVDRWMTYVAKERGVSVEALLKIRTLLENEQLKMSEEGFQVWAAKQVYLALGIGLIAAAENGVDATPMEGFSPEALDRLLGLDRRGLKSVALMALGYRDVYNDWNLKLKKVRRPAEELFITL
jgi:nitroreductase